LLLNFVNPLTNEIQAKGWTEDVNKQLPRMLQQLRETISILRGLHFYTLSRRLPITSN
jgi:hypothetical protein